MRDLKKIIGKLDRTCRRALEEAAAACMAQTHYDIEIEHFLLKLVEAPGTDLAQILRYYEVEPAEVLDALTRSLEGFKRGNGRTPAMSPHLVHLLEEAWVFSSLQLGAEAVRSGGVLLALFETEKLRALLAESCPPLFRISAERLRTDAPELARTSHELSSTPLPAPSDEGDNEGKKTALGRFTVDLTAEARAGRIDPIVGRDAEIRQIVDILLRRRQNNPILTGEAGVGKTAVVEGFACRVAAGDVPPPLRRIAVRMLDVGLLQAGAGVKGAFEERLKQVVAEVKASPVPVILFIDEAHTLVGAGGAAGQNDAANLLKPALARGELRTIAATTWAEYKRHFEKDPALARRFQDVKVDEPTEPRAVEMLRGVAARLEAHHGVRVLDEAIREAVRLSHRYITGRQLPDKAISVLDTACARVAVGQSSLPPALEEVHRAIERGEVERRILRREAAAGQDHARRIEEIETALEADRRREAALQARWEREGEAVREILALRRGLEDDPDGGDRQGGRDRALVLLRERQDALADLQGEAPLVPVCVDAATVAAVVSGWTGIPIGRMLTDEIEAVMTLHERMRVRVVGQDAALEAIARSIRTSRADLVDPEKPVGVFLLVGPSGVGKTETALALADILYGGRLVTLNMSEYQEAYSVSKLKGAPAGYVGYGRGGVLTEAVRRNPHAVVLLDEIEKAHADVIELFYQVFDKGVMEDSEGVAIDFKNAVLLLTSNLAGDLLYEAGPDGDREALHRAIREELLRHFPPAFLGRLVVVPYLPLGEREIERIVRLKLGKIGRRFEEHHGAGFTYSDALVDLMARRCTEANAGTSGARNVDHLLTQGLLPDLSGETLRRMAAGELFASVHVDVGTGGRFAYAFGG